MKHFLLCLGVIDRNIYWHKFWWEKCVWKFCVWFCCFLFKKQAVGATLSRGLLFEIFIWLTSLTLSLSLNFSSRTHIYSLIQQYIHKTYPLKCEMWFWLDYIVFLFFHVWVDWLPKRLGSNVWHWFERQMRTRNFSQSFLVMSWIKRLWIEFALLLLAP